MHRLYLFFTSQILKSLETSKLKHRWMIKNCLGPKVPHNIVVCMIWLLSVINKDTTFLKLICTKITLILKIKIKTPNRVLFLLIFHLFLCPWPTTGICEWINFYQVFLSLLQHVRVRFEYFAIILCLLWAISIYLS